MNQHDVGIHGAGVTRPTWRARCDSCDWWGPPHKDRKLAQLDAIEHQGGTLRTRERRPHAADPTESMDEMFPDAGRTWRSA